MDARDRGFGVVDHGARFLQLGLDGAIELITQLARGASEVRDRFADLTHDLGQLGRSEHDQGQDHNQQDLHWPHAEDVHRRRLCRLDTPTVDYPRVGSSGPYLAALDDKALRAVQELGGG